MPHQTKFKMHLPLHLCRAFFRYDPASGELHTRVGRGSQLAGAPIMGISSSGHRYARVMVHGKSYTVVSVCFALGHDRMAEGRLAFRDGNPANLRLNNIVEVVGSHRPAALAATTHKKRSPELRHALRDLLSYYKQNNADAPAPTMEALLIWAATYLGAWGGFTDE